MVVLTWLWWWWYARRLTKDAFDQLMRQTKTPTTFRQNLTSSKDTVVKVILNSAQKLTCHHQKDKTSPVSIMVMPSLATTCFSSSAPLHLWHWLLPPDPVLLLPPELNSIFLPFLWWFGFGHLGPRSDPGPSCQSPPCSDPESRGYLKHFLSFLHFYQLNYHIGKF